MQQPRREGLYLKFQVLRRKDWRKNWEVGRRISEISLNIEGRGMTPLDWTELGPWVLTRQDSDNLGKAEAV